MVEINKPLDIELPELGARSEAVEDDTESALMPAHEFASTQEPFGAYPERVRFAVPASLSFDGYAEKFSVSVINLSAHGIACTGPQGLAPKDRLRLSFPLSPATAAQSFLCEVIWARNTSEEDANYGLHFVELSEKLAEEVQLAVRERAEGRAAEWPLPAPAAILAEAATEVAQARPQANRAMAGLAGLAAGIGLTLLLGALYVGFTSPDLKIPPQAVVSANTDTPEVRPGSGDALPFEALEPAFAPSTDPQAADAGRPDAAPQAPSEPKAPAERSIRLRKIGLLRVEESPDQVAMTLLANGPVGSHQTFWLHDPPRLVVDIKGRQSGFQSKYFEVGHPLVQRVRVGQHPGKVRFVIETGADVAQTVVATPQGNGLRVELARRQ